MQLIDLTGLKFGYLTVLERATNDIYGRSQWKCKCDCGNITIIPSGDLRHKNRQRRYCSNQCVLKNKPIDLTGQRFGRLTVIKIYDDKEHIYKNWGAKWVCKCDCGEETIVNSYDLRNGKVQSCGCLRKEVISDLRTKEIMLGERFGKLTVIKYLYNKDGHAWWKCKCDCGNIISVTGVALRAKQKMSCGCLVSRGEALIESFLIDLKINYIHQYSFNDLLSENGNKLKFDFAILNKNNILLGLIEFDGFQHFIEQDIFNQTLEEIQSRDIKKNQYCQLHNIPLIRFDYIEFNNNKLTIDYFLNRIQTILIEKNNDLLI